MQVRLAMLGYGNVGQALARLLAAKATTLREDYALTCMVTGILTRRSGGWIAPAGITPDDLVASGWPGGPLPTGVEPWTGDGVAFARDCPADALVEVTTLDPHHGEPALSHVRAALLAGKHVVTANKGPIAHGYRELRDLAKRKGKGLRFESTVLDGLPVFNLAEFALRATTITGFRGILNGTSNYVLSSMARGASLEDAVRDAQQWGIAEANPAYDLDGWDAAVKGVALANVLMGADLRPHDVHRAGLGAAAMRARRAAMPAGRVLKQIATGRRDGERIMVTVQLEDLPGDDIFALVHTAIALQTDTMGTVTLIEDEGGPEFTAFGLLSDIINMVL
jgi:homoserine dehydrogenase